MSDSAPSEALIRWSLLDTEPPSDLCDCDEETCICDTRPPTAEARPASDGAA